MKFTELEQSMRIFETANDQVVLPGVSIVARIDGRNFSTLTRSKQNFDAPYDERFRDLMIETLLHVMNCGFRVVFGYTQSDEMSLLFHAEENSFGRKIRKINSVLAGEASAKFSVGLGSVAAFDCRVCQLPQKKHVIDYFRWRHEDAARNAINAHSFWMLRKEGDSADQATSKLKGMSVRDKNEFLFQRGLNFNDVPMWQKRGIGVYRPQPNEDFRVDFELPMKDAYSEFVEKVCFEFQKENL